MSSSASGVTPQALSWSTRATRSSAPSYRGPWLSGIVQTPPLLVGLPLSTWSRSPAPPEESIWPHQLFPPSPLPVKREDGTALLDRISPSSSPPSTQSHQVELVWDERTPSEDSNGNDRDNRVDNDEHLFKTELCRNWGPPAYHCQYGDACNFAHGESELRERLRRSEYKSKLCDEPVRIGVRCCSYTTSQQSRCNYCHPGEAVRRKCNRSYFDSEYVAMLAKEYPGNPHPFGMFF
ncbi:C3H1-type domain-containing protein [Plasmodiophora brassicae]|uniref:C3H1-type domain-containing protein n=1 Tax=Plasmodiophora brassicae TaxID=37360 RepID=A0A0G4J8A0_PLABS|nr:hypothetical protein PBRA_003329 [Plasmodiophora brassicae]SPQ99682.1 unnamed protein product [Plasmodiophora brassicae]